MNVSYEGIGQWAATFACSGVSEGQAVKVSFFLKLKNIILLQIEKSQNTQSHLLVVVLCFLIF